MQSDDADVTSVSDTYEKKKTIDFDPTPTLSVDEAANIDLRIKFQLEATVAGGAGWAQIYRDAGAVGIERTTAAAATDFSEDISGWSVGDEINIYMKRDGTDTATVRNFRVYAKIGSVYEKPSW